MAMTAQEAFKFGFLLRCAEEGLTQAEICARIKVAQQGAPGLGTIGTLASTGLHGLKSLALLGLVGSAGLGAGTGYAAARMTEPDSDPEEAKLQETISTYQLFADAARRNAQRRRLYRQITPSRPRLLR